MTSPRIERLLHEFRDFAARLGEPAARDVQYVISTLAKAEQAVFEDVTRRAWTAATEPVLVLCVRGSFTGLKASAGVAAPTGMALTVIVSVNSGFTFVYGIADDVPDLSVLGFTATD